MNVSSLHSFGSVMSHSFLRQIAHYMCPSDHLDNDSIRCASIKFVSQACKFWQMQSSSKPDLLQILLELDSKQ